MADPIELRVNGVAHAPCVHPMRRLLDVLREDLGLTGTKEGCGEGECGACAVLIDGQLVDSCLVPVTQVRGHEVTTIEGMAEGDTLADIQQAFIDHGGAQCGICTPGMILAARELLDRVSQPGEADIREALAGNICRCTGYTRIFESVLAAIELNGATVRGDPDDFELVTARTLAEACDRVAEGYRPLAGGTDVMVLLSSGKLGHATHGRWVDLWAVDELRAVRVDDGMFEVGALTTYTGVRRHPLLSRELPMLAQAASETGGIAIQNRGTLGGNIGNGSPAADSPPALLAYGARLVLASKRGERTVPYEAFHTAYKKTVAAPDELVARILVPRVDATGAGRVHYYRKVGPRRAQAISKVCFAACADRDGAGRVRDVKIALGGVAPVPLRAVEAERAILAGEPFERVSEALGRAIAPIDDVRSSAAYRRRVADNLLREFLRHVAHPS